MICEPKSCLRAIQAVFPTAVIVLVFLSGLGVAKGEKPTIVFFGGWSSTTNQMEMWRQAAHRSVLAATYDFATVSYPEGASENGALAAERMKPAIIRWHDEIVRRPSAPYILACHSSGCGIANVLAGELLQRRPPPKNVMLVNLDGGRKGGGLPSKEMIAAFPTECWTAISSDGLLHSPYYEDARRLCPSSIFRELKLTGCRTAMCLHFKLLNHSLQEGEGARQRNYIRTGYDDLQINFDWLDGANVWVKSLPNNQQN